MNLSKILIAFSAFIILTGCGPVYETNYMHIPPTAADGQMCVSQCQESQTKCLQIKGERAKSYSCQEDYDACFQMCGGELKPLKRCVANCK